MRKHTRASIVAAAVVAAGGIGAAGIATGTTPWSRAAGNLAASTHVASGVASGQAGTSIGHAFVVGVKAAAASTHADSARLDSRTAHAVAKAATPAATSHTVAGGGAQAAGHAQAAGQAQAAGHAQAPAATPAKAQAAVAPSAAVAAQPGQAHTAKPQAAAPHPAQAKPAAPKPAAPPAPPAPPAKPYNIYDSVTPGSIPQGQQVATYANGNYAASASAVSGRGHVLWIDTNGSDPNADALDVEPGDATPTGAASWVQAKLSSHPHSVAVVYTMRSEWGAVKSSVGALPPWMQSKVRYWIADPTGVPHVVAGSSATQWYWGNSYDITTANPNFQH